VWEFLCSRSRWSATDARPSSPVAARKMKFGGSLSQSAHGATAGIYARTAARLWKRRIVPHRSLNRCLSNRANLQVASRPTPQFRVALPRCVAHVAHAPMRQWCTKRNLSTSISVHQRASVQVRHEPTLEGAPNVHQRCIWYVRIRDAQLLTVTRNIAHLRPPSGRYRITSHVEISSSSFFGFST
jgi:hypothetical protein